MGYGHSLVLRFDSRRARAGKPYGIFVHGALDPWFDWQYPIKHLKKMLYWPVQYAVFRDALAVFFTTEVRARSERKPAFVRTNGTASLSRLGITDPEERGREPAGQIETFYRRFPELRGRRYLLFLARLHAKKGCDLLLEAFAQDCDLRPRSGPRDGRPRSRGNAGKASAYGRTVWSLPAEYTGRASLEATSNGVRSGPAMHSSFPSHSENFGIAVVESLAVGRPVLISNQVNIWPEIESDGAGIVEDDTPEGTERMLRRWFDLLPAERDAMVARTRPSFLKRYTLNRTVDAIERQFSLAPLQPERTTQRTRFRLLPAIPFRSRNRAYAASNHEKANGSRNSQRISQTAGPANVHEVLGMSERANVAVIILTYNETLHLPRALEHIKGFAQEIFVVDSFSTDGTADLAKAYGAHVLQHPFQNYAKQFEWALDNVPITAEWVMRLDADEVVEADLATEIVTKLPKLPSDVTGVNLKLKTVFQGKSFVTAEDIL